MLHFFRSTTFLALFVLIVGAVLPSYSQSGRSKTDQTNRRANSRPATPTPTPTPNPTEIVADDATDESGEIITVNTRLVTIPVRVLDRNGRFVAGIPQENFKVFEDNAEQEISHFSNEAQPFTVALVLDMSYSAKFKADEIQLAAISFIDLLRPDDRVMVISFDEEVHVLCEPTSDRKEIYRAIRKTRIATGTSLYEAVDTAINKEMRRIEGRKALVLFTDGVDTTSRKSHDLDNLRDALELDALIYPIRYDTFADVQAMKRNPSVIVPTSKPRGTPPIVGGGNFPFPMPGPVMGVPDDKGTTVEEYARGEEYLNQLALRTGGTVYVADTLGNLNRAFSRIASELREFYSIGYYPKDDGKKGSRRKIKVRVDKPNVAVKARDSYVVPDRTGS